MLLRVVIIVSLCITIGSSAKKENVKEMVVEKLGEGGKYKQQTVKVVNEHTGAPVHSSSNAAHDHTDKSKAVPAKATSKPTSESKVKDSKKLDESKKASGETKKKSGSSSSDGKQAGKPKAEKVTAKETKHSETTKATVTDSKKQSEKSSDGLVDKLFNVFAEVKNSILESPESSATADADAIDSAKRKKKMKDSTAL